ncbi:hypothetical protein GQ457_10G012610 [Hibiscus cannabinus]
MVEIVGIWIPMMPIPNRRTWLLVSGKLVHAWSEKKFDNIARLWGEHAKVDIETLAQSSFERARFQIETNWIFHIDEELDLRGSQFFGNQDGEEDAEERRNVSLVKGGDSGNCSRGIVVPNSLLSKSMNSLEMERIWEGKKLLDWRVMEIPRLIDKETIRMIQCDEERVVALKLVTKRGRGRPKIKHTESDRIKVILREVEEIVHLGKLIGAATNANETAIIQDVAPILQEMKLDYVSEWFVKQVWFSDKFQFVFAPSNGRSSGALCF